MSTNRGYTDERLAVLLQNGDEVAYTEIYMRYAPALTAFAESKLYSLEDARDVIQDLFTELWKARRDTKIKGSLKSYLYAAARYRIISKIRKNLVREDYAEKLRVISPAYFSLEEELNARELGRSIHAKLGQLPEKAKEIFRQSREENKSTKEIAQSLDLSEQTIKNQISLILRHLRRTLLSCLL